MPENGRRDLIHRLKLNAALGKIQNQRLKTHWKLLLPSVANL
jgi:hypothetical protein